MIAKISRTLLALLGLLSIASTALGQGNTFNPYGNSGYADYREFGNAMVSNNPALPGQSVIDNKPLVGRPRANSFDEYANELDSMGSDPATQRRASSSLPYYLAYERTNRDYNRVYKPNDTKADREFYERQRQRDLDYLNALRERDPVKRAKLLRQSEQNSLNRPASSRSGTARAATAPRPNTSGSPATTRSSAPLDRRQPAPVPFAPEAARRPATTRAPAPPLGRSNTAPPPPLSRSDSTRSRPAPPDPSAIPTPPPR
jgi:hypothetical protein